jgi:hypothetical protein
MANNDVVAHYAGKFCDMDSGEPIQDGGGVWVEFFSEACPDQLLTEGGTIAKSHPKVKDIRKLEDEALALLRQTEPFAEEEPKQPKNTSDLTAMRVYKDTYAEWEERRAKHDGDLKARAALLKDHPENKDLFEVSPAGRPIYLDRDYIRIVVPGDMWNQPVRPVMPADIEKHRAAYNAYKAGKSQVVHGTPLEQWPGVSKSQVKELVHFGVRTVEDLAQTSDANLANVGQYVAIRGKARDWLAQSRGMKPIEEARAEAKRANAQIEDLRRQIAALQEAQGKKQ